MDDANERTLPRSLDAERSVLSCMLHDNRVIDDVVQIVRERDFTKDAHCKVFVAIVALHERGHAIDTIILAEHLKQQNQIEDVGRHAYIQELWDAAATGANVEYYARIVRDKALARDLIYTAKEITDNTYAHTMPSDELLADAERKIFALAEERMTGQVETIAEGLRLASDRIDEWQTHVGTGVAGLPTGFVDLDEKTGGLQESELIIIAARPSIGKTTFILNMARHITVDQQRPVFFVSLEQSKVDLNLRLLSCQARIDRRRFQSVRLTDEEVNRLTTARRALAEVQERFFIDETKLQNVLRIAANARRLKRRQGIAVVFVDYLGLIEMENPRDPRYEQVGATTRRLKILAGELALPIVVLAQLNREPETRTDRKPRLSDLRESGSIEQDSDTVMLMHQDGEEDPTSGIARVVVNIAKCRNGPTGEATLAFVKRFMRFGNFAGEYPRARHPG